MELPEELKDVVLKLQEYYTNKLAKQKKKFGTLRNAFVAESKEREKL
jgi:hypothetical protein